MAFLSGCTNKESINQLKKENTRLKKDNVRLLESIENLKKENRELQEANERLNNEKSANVDNLPYPIELKISDSLTPDLNQIAKKLFSDYLSSYTNNNGNTRQLKSYTIDKINIEKSDASSFVFSVEFSVQPYNAQEWTAGNGDASTQNGWIKNKIYFVKVGIEGQTYTMLSHGTSP